MQARSDTYSGLPLSCLSSDLPVQLLNNRSIRTPQCAPRNVRRIRIWNVRFCGLPCEYRFHSFSATSFSSIMATSLSSSDQPTPPTSSFTCAAVFAPGMGITPAARLMGVEAQSYSKAAIAIMFCFRPPTSSRTAMACQLPAHRAVASNGLSTCISSWQHSVHRAHLWRPAS